MRGVRYHTYGAPEMLQIDEVPCPVPETGQVLIEVEAIGLNVIDTVFRRGSGQWTRPLPGALTGDVVGRGHGARRRGRGRGARRQGGRHVRGRMCRLRDY